MRGVARRCVDFGREGDLDRVLPAVVGYHRVEFRVGRRVRAVHRSFAWADPSGATGSRRADLLRTEFRASHSLFGQLPQVALPQERSQRQLHLGRLEERGGRAANELGHAECVLALVLQFDIEPVLSAVHAEMARFA